MNDFDGDSAVPDDDADAANTVPAKDETPDEEEKEKGRKGGLLREIAIVIGIVLALMFVVNTFFFRQYVVPSESMEPTLHGCTGCTNDRIVVDKISYRFSDPKPGDVVVFKAPSDSWDRGWNSPRSGNPVIHKIQDVLSWFALSPPNENNLVKRVIATEGQTVECHAADGKGVTVNGKSLREPYIDKNLQNAQYTDDGTGGGSCYGDDFGPVTVPKGNVWVMGDNRSDSADSRYHMDDEFHGTVPVKDIRGKVRFIIYPFSRFGGVDAVDPQ